MSMHAFAQTKGDDTAVFLDRAAGAVRGYVDGFKDLTAEETTTAESLDARGAVQDRTTIVSALVIYRSQQDERVFAEYRLVLSVNGHEVKNRDERAMRVWERLGKSRSVQEELQRLSDEGNRYQPYLRASGYTLFQAPALASECRKAFTLEDAGREIIQGRTARIFSYAQVAPCSVFHYSLALPPGLQSGKKLHRGRLWLDAESARLLREERDLYVEAPDKPGYVIHVLHFGFEYAPSAFDFLVPMRIIMEVVRHSAQGPASPVTRVTQRYGPFSRFDVKVEQKVVVPTPYK